MAFFGCIKCFSGQEFGMDPTDSGGQKGQRLSADGGMCSPGVSMVNAVQREPTVTDRVRLLVSSTPHSSN